MQTVYAPTQLSWGMGAGDVLVNPSNVFSGSFPQIQPPNVTGNPDVSATSSQVNPATPKYNYLLIMLAIVGLLILLKVGSEHEKSGMDPHLMGVGVWNFLVVTIMATLGIAAFKTVLIKYPVPGLTQVVSAA